MLRKLFSFRFPQNILITINILGLFLVIYYNNAFEKASIGMAIGLTLLIYISNFLLLKISPGDRYLFLIVSMLMSISILMIYRIDPQLGIKQVIWFIIGIAALFISYFVVKSIKQWPHWMMLYMGLSLGLFLATLIFGSNIKGATNWIRIGRFTFQPAEIIKVLFIFFLASYYVNRDKSLTQHTREKKYSLSLEGIQALLLQNKYGLAAIVYGNIAFLFIQKDLGSALLFYMIFIAIAFVYEKDDLFILYNLGVASVLAVISYFTFSHVRIRVETWINPWKDIAGKGYQITQSLFSIASGGFLGTGVGMGHPEFIPEVHTDFIFAAICEEMGILTGIAVIMLYLVFIYRGIKITLEQKNPFYRIVSFGITCLFGFQSFIILGGVTKMIPLTGVTLPFLSYGGSSLIASFGSLGILQATSEQLPDLNNDEDRPDDSFHNGQDQGERDEDNE